MAYTRWVSPDAYHVNTSAVWFRGTKSASGLPGLFHNGAIAADANVVISIPLPLAIRDDGAGEYIKYVDLFHYLSATSAGITPISAAGGTVRFREIKFVDGTLVTTGAAVTSAGTVSAGVFNAPNSLYGSPALPSAVVSATDWSPTTLSAAGIMVSALSTSAWLERFTNVSIPAEAGGKVRPYVPRACDALVMVISASVGASCVWEHYGTRVTYDTVMAP